MLKHKLLYFTCLAVALSGPAVFADDKGGSSSSSGSSSGKGGGDDKGGSSSSSNSGSSSGSGSQSGKGDDKGGQSSSSGKGSDDGAGHNNGDDKGGQNTNSGPGNNNNNGQALQKTEVKMALMPAGAAAGIMGNVDVRAQGDRQRLKVEIEGNLGDGDTFTVFANGVPVGTITVRLGEGELELEAENGAMLPGGIAASAITTIEVRNAAGQTVLTATFAPLSNPGAVQTPPPAGGLVKKQVELKAPPQSTPASGTIELRTQGAAQQLKIEVEAAAPDGTIVTIFANNGIRLGTATFRLGEAEFKLDNSARLPAGINSLNDIATIVVTDGNQLTLAASL